MSSTIRDIITEGLSRANIVSRKQTAPANIVESALRLLKGVAAKYSNDNLLQFLRREVEFTPTSGTVSIGEDDGVDVTAEGLHDVKKVYLKNADNSYTELKFVAYEDFYNDGYGNYTYSYQPTTDKQGTIYIKNRVLELGRSLKVIYNVKWDFDLNTELHVPDQYVELFNAALAHKLAVTFPRLSVEQVTILKNELEEMISNVKVATRANKRILRRPSGVGYSYGDFCNGDFL